MKRFLLFLLPLIFYGLSLNAQETRYSKAQKFNGDKDLYQIGGWVQDKLLVYYTEKGESLIDLYDKDMNRKAIVALGFMPSSPNKVELLTKKNQSMILYSAQLNSKEVFYAALLDKDARLIGRPKKLEEASQNFFGNSKFDYKLVHNVDNSKAGVFAYKIKDGYLECQLNIIDDSLNVIQNSNFKVRTKDYFGLDQLILKDDGSLILLLTDKSTNKNDEVAEARVYNLVAENETKTTVSAYPIDFGDNFTGNIFIKEDFSQPNVIYFAGLTNDKKGLSNGTFSGKIDLTAPNNQRVAGVSSKFEAVMNNLEKTYSSGYNDFNIKEVVIKNDGGLLLISEAYQKVYKTNYSINSHYRTPNLAEYIEYNYGDILIVGMDIEKKIQSFNRISKFQRTIDDGGKFSSIAFINTGSQLGLLFNEFNKNNNRLLLSFLNNELQAATQEIATKAGMPVQWIPKRAKQISSKELIVPIVDGRKLQFLKINF